MALDRQSIEKRDFPIGRRGYEPASVDAHLARVASEVDALRRDASSAIAAASDSPAPAAASSPPGSSLSAIASGQVQAIVEAAESSAASIEREAREHAAQLEQDADLDAQKTREDAIARSQEHIGKVRDATMLMLQRVDAMEGELGALVESLRTGANRLSADLSLLSGNMGELYGAVRGPGSDDSVPACEPELAIAPLEPEPVAAGGDPVGAADAAEDGDVEGARLIALNMALNGQTRAETDKYLAKNFDLADRAALLDEVYATVDG